ncbi:MAG: SDR family NAD(P)-dependent oxidoreductase, partial [Burkholderiales bacterium]
MTMAHDGLVVAITGSGQGIGRALARSFTREGAHVVVSDIDAAACRAAADELATLGVPADITRAEDCAALVAKTVEQFGRLDVMVCN